MVVTCHSSGAIGASCELKRSKIISPYLLILLLLNLVAATYLVSCQAWFRSTTRSGREMQLQILQNKLKSSESQINTLRCKMDTLEQILVKMEEWERRRILVDEGENTDFVVGESEQNRSEKTVLLEEMPQLQLAMDDFYNTEFEFRQENS